MVSNLKRFGIALVAILAAQSALGATFNLFQPATGLLKGNASTYVTTAATSSDVIATFSGTCNSTTFLRADGSCQVIAATTPGGSTTQVQFNNAGAFAGDAGLTYNSGTDTLAVAGDVTIAGQSVCQENGTNCPSAGTPPGGASGNVQYNDGAGGFAGEAAFTYNSGTDALTAGTMQATTAATVGGVNVCLSNGTNCPAGGATSVDGGQTSPNCSTVTTGGFCTAAYSTNSAARASTTTVANDTVLAFTNLPQATYSVAGCVLISGNGGGWRVNLGGSGQRNVWGSGQVASGHVLIAMSDGTDWTQTSTPNTGYFCFIGNYAPNVAATTFAIRWAQQASNATGTFIVAGSWVTLRRMT